MPRVTILPGGPGTTGRYQNAKRRIHGSAFFYRVPSGKRPAPQEQSLPASLLRERPV